MSRNSKEALLKVENLSKLYPVSTGIIASLLGKTGRFVHAVDDISFDLKRGTILGVAGESGCGKTTLGKLLVLLETPSGGRITYNGEMISHLKKGMLKAYRKRVQMIFQDPYESLDPRYNVYSTISEPLTIHGIAPSREEKIERVIEMLDVMGMMPPETFLDKYPHELSGGQRQRLAIARAMILNPEFIVADEPVSMLDSSIRAGIMNLLLNFNKEKNVTILFITHDLACSRYMSNNIIIMYLGKIVEMGPTEDIIATPQHPYTKLLLSCVAVPDPSYKRVRKKYTGEPPNPIDMPKGCRFQNRCPVAWDTCRNKDPVLKEIFNGHFVACYSV